MGCDEYVVVAAHVDSGVSMLLRRGWDHLHAGRVAAALADAGQAVRLGGNIREVRQLQEQAARMMLSGQRNHRHAARVLQVVRQQMRQGHLGIARHLLAAVPMDESRAMDVMHELNDRQLAADAALQRAQQAVDRSDWETALQQVGAAMSADPSDPRARELAIRIEPAVCEMAAAALAAGRVDQAARLIAPFETDAAAQTPAGRDLLRAVQWCREAWSAADHGKFGRAIELLARLRTMYASAGWIAEAVDHLRKAADAMEVVRCGPLGLLGDAGWSNDAETTSPPPADDASIVMSRVLVGGLRGNNGLDTVGASAQPQPTSDSGLPTRFLLQVDGVGSFVVVCGDRVTLGPVAGGTMSGGRAPDVALVADASAATVEITRDEGDYFLNATNAVKVNEQGTTQKLLTTGDRIALSSRCRVGFAIPNAAATTAVIDLVGARYPRGDVRRVILLDRDLVIGAGTVSHVRMDALPSPVVLHLHRGQLQAEAAEPVESPAGVISPGQALPMDTPLRCGELGFVITRA